THLRQFRVIDGERRTYVLCLDPGVVHCRDKESAFYPGQVLSLAILDALRNHQLGIVELDDNGLEGDPQLLRCAPATMPIDDLINPLALGMTPNLNWYLLPTLFKR